MYFKILIFEQRGWTVLTIPKIKLKNQSGIIQYKSFCITFSSLVYVIEAYPCGHDLDLSMNYAALNCRVLPLEVTQLLTFMLLERHTKVQEWQMAPPGQPSRLVPELGLASDLATLAGSLGLPFFLHPPMPKPPPDSY